MNTKQLRQKILDLAIRGQLVPQDSNDEPASVLLEKIRAEKQTLIEQKKIKKDKKSSYITCDLSPYRKYTEHFADGSSKDITDEIPFEIPENWMWCRLGEITMINPKNNIEDNKEVSFIPMTLISDGFSNKHSYEVRLWGEVKKGFTHFQEGDIGVAKITPCFENRKSVIFSNLINEVGAGTTELHVLRPFAYSEIKKYIYWFINTESFIQRGISHFSGAVGQQRVGKDILENTLIPLPPLAEQRRIVEKIEELLALVDNLEANKTDLQSYIKQAKSKVLEMAVRGELVPQDSNDEPASVLLERIKNEQKSSKSKGKTTEHNTHYEEELPKNWAKTTLGECFEWGSGGTPTSSVKKYYDGNIPWLVIGDLNDNYINTSDKTITQFGLENSSAKLVPKGTLLLAMYGSIGKLGIAGMPLATNQAIAFALENKEINTKYLFYYLLSVRSSLNLLGKGATQKNISQSIIKDFHFPLPPLAEQHRIVEKIEHIFAVLEELEENIL